MEVVEYWQMLVLCRARTSLEHYHTSNLCPLPFRRAVFETLSTLHSDQGMCSSERSF